MQVLKPRAFLKRGGEGVPLAGSTFSQTIVESMSTVRSRGRLKKMAFVGMYPKVPNMQLAEHSAGDPPRVRPISVLPTWGIDSYDKYVLGTAEQALHVARTQFSGKTGAVVQVREGAYLLSVPRIGDDVLSLNSQPSGDSKTIEATDPAMRYLLSSTGELIDFSQGARWTETIIPARRETSLTGEPLSQKRSLDQRMAEVLAPL